MVLLSVVPALYKVVFEKVLKRLVVELVIGTSSRPVFLLGRERRDSCFGLINGVVNNSF